MLGRTIDSTGPEVSQCRNREEKEQGPKQTKKKERKVNMRINNTMKRRPKEIRKRCRKLEIMETYRLTGFQQTEERTYFKRWRKSN